jgi:predicted  nucleic acid-binding Zn-ribbon protein
MDIHHILKQIRMDLQTVNQKLDAFGAAVGQLLTGYKSLAAQTEQNTTVINDLKATVNTLQAELSAGATSDQLQPLADKLDALTTEIQAALPALVTTETTTETTTVAQ